MPKCSLHWLCAHVSLENMRIEGRRASWNSNVPGETVVCGLFRANWNGSSRYSPLVSATIFDPRTCGNQHSRPPLSCGSAQNPRSR